MPAEGGHSEGRTSPVQPVDGDVCGLCDRIFVARRSAQVVRDEHIARELAISDGFSICVFNRALRNQRAPVLQFVYVLDSTSDT
jgi:hypothetical protein